MVNKCNIATYNIGGGEAHHIMFNRKKTRHKRGHTI